MKTVKTFRLYCALTLLCAFACQTMADEPSARSNQLTAAEKAAGWKLLFDGKTTTGWRSFKKQTFPAAGWTVEDGWLKCIANGHGGDILSAEQFTEFELSWEWRISTNGNNGVKYFITETRDSAIGHEYQMLDDDGHPDGKRGPKRQAAAFYDVLPPATDKPYKPPGAINHSRIIVQGNHVEHWLNGAKVLEYELGSDPLKAAVAQSKFKNVPGFGAKIKGHILLTEHHDEAWFSNIKIRELAVRP